MIQINNYLHFNGNCRTAMEFYKGIFGGEVEMQTIGESPMASQMPPESQNSVMHATLKNGKVTLMGSDMFGEEKFSGSVVSLTLISDSVEELKELFAKLAEGGKVNQPLQEVYFGTYGDLTDKFGVPWMFQADKKN